MCNDFIRRPCLSWTPSNWVSIKYGRLRYGELMMYLTDEGKINEITARELANGDGPLYELLLTKLNGAWQRGYKKARESKEFEDQRLLTEMGELLAKQALRIKELETKKGQESEDSQP